MPRPTPKPAAPGADPLADLRDETPPGPPPGEQDETLLDGELTAVYSPAWHEQRTNQIVAAYHADSTAQGFAHKGGACGCRYLARKALQAAVGEPVEALEPVQ